MFPFFFDSPLKPEGQGSFSDGISNIFTGNLDWQRQQTLNRQQQEFNSAQAQKNRDWQEKMSNSAYQRATADLEKAGLNPALLAGGNSPASTPSGGVASAQAGSPKTPDLIKLVTSAMKIAAALA